MNRRLIGAAAFQAPLGSVSASWPLGALTISDDGITVELRSSVLRRLLAGRGGDHDSSSEWQAAWSSIASVDVAARSIVLRKQAGKSCRFATLSRGKIRPVIDEIEYRRIPTRKVSSTIKWFWAA